MLVQTVKGIIKLIQIIKITCAYYLKVKAALDRNKNGTSVHCPFLFPRSIFPEHIKFMGIFKTKI